MAFIVGSVLIGAGVGIAGAKMQSDAIEGGAKTASRGANAEVELNRESRDLARGDQAPYRQAGATALDALMSMTGLQAPGGGPTNFGQDVGTQIADERINSGYGGQVNPEDYIAGFKKPSGDKGDKTINRFLRNNPYSSGYEGGATQYISDFQATLGNKGTKRWGKYAGRNPFPGLAYGGPTYPGRAYGGYTVNEFGPENRYAGGVMQRTPNPQVVGGQTGYVQPNGGFGGVAIPGGGALPDDLGGGRPRDGGGYMGGQQIPFDNGGVVHPSQQAPQGAPPAGPPQENPGGVEGGYNFMTDPGYNFRIGEGQRAIERGASARGQSLAGGTQRALTRYAQDYASNEYNNVYNRISNIAGLGQVSSQNAGNAALQGGVYMGNAASNAANATAYGQVGAGNAWANAGNQIAQLPWGNVFGNSATTNSGMNTSSLGGTRSYNPNLFPDV